MSADSFPIPPPLAESCAAHPARRDWLAALPDVVRELAGEWSLTLGDPYLAEVSCAWVAPATRADGSGAVLKLAMPHLEGEDEIAGLRFWDGDPTVRLLDADDERGAMLLERCVPGTTLRGLPEEEQDVVIARLLRRLWRTPPSGAFRALAAMTSAWADETRAQADAWPDAGLVRAGLELLEGLPLDGADAMLLATDLHAGNVLRAEREPWLVIDPKPFLGDPAYDATQHLLNCRGRLHADPIRLIARMAQLLDLDERRLRLWTFARVAAEPRDEWRVADLELARVLGGHR
jgi:streptomycin 6-kinase